jgi:hypothetical protein
LTSMLSRFPELLFASRARHMCVHITSTEGSIYKEHENTESTTSTISAIALVLQNEVVCRIDQGLGWLVSSPPGPSCRNVDTMERQNFLHGARMTGSEQATADEGQRLVVAACPASGLVDREPVSSEPSSQRGRTSGPD